MSEKLQKVLARVGIGSRRTVEAWIKAGRITVDGAAAHIGQRVEPNAYICVDGRQVKIKNTEEETRIIMYHKPEGEICTKDDPEGRPTVYRDLPAIESGRWLYIGRLDINTSGLLLFCNNGELVNKLAHPSHEIEREYAVRVLGEVDDEVCYNLTQGVELADGNARFEHIVEAGGKGANRWFHVVVCEGRNRMVRRLWESQNLKVSRLIRVRFGPIALPRSLDTGSWLELKGSDLNKLLALS